MTSSRKPSRRLGVIGVSIATLAVALLAPLDVAADGKTAFNAEQLRKNSDFRVRTQAALNLGTSDDATAVKPLCECLDDGSEVESVRVACAAALGKLKKPGSKECLGNHTADSSAKVKEQVATSITALGGGGGSSTASSTCPNAPSSAKAKYYVGVDVSNKSSRPDADVKSLVGKEFRCRLSALGRFRVAPDGQTTAKEMSNVVTKDKLDGYYITLTVDPIAYGAGSLKVNLKMTIMTYTRDLKGEATKSLTDPSVSSPSKPDEDSLLALAAQKLADSFADLKP